MLRRRRKQLLESEAGGNIETIFFEMRRTLRVTGLDVSVRTLAVYNNLFAVAWDAMKGNVETRGFEDAADELRAVAAAEARSLPRMTAMANADLGDSERFRLRAALDAHHYAYPKLMLLVSAVHLGLRGQVPGLAALPPGSLVGSLDRLDPGVAPGMRPLEVVTGKTDRQSVHTILDEIGRAPGWDPLPGGFCALALWPAYLEQVWSRLRPLKETPQFQMAADNLEGRARSRAAALPYAVDLRRERLADHALDEFEDFAALTATLAQGMPALTLTFALLSIEGA